MGQQVSFYFATRDEKPFLGQGCLQDIVLLRQDSLQRPEAVEIQHPCEAIATEEEVRHLVLYPRELVTGVRFQAVHKLGSYFINVSSSPVIDYLRSRYLANEGVVVFGRIWYERTFWDKDDKGNDILVEKNPELLRLYNRLASWIRRHCKRLPNGNYLGPHAEELHEKGAELR